MSHQELESEKSRKGSLGLLLSTIYPLILWVRNNESQGDEIMGL